jgi:hypothetical protein
MNQEVIDWTPEDNSRGVLGRIDRVFMPEETRLDFLRTSIASKLKH